MATTTDGRRAARRRAPAEKGAWVGIDLGGTKVYAVALRGDEVVAEAKAKTPTQGGPLAVVDAIAALVAGLRTAVPADAGSVAGVGVGAPGVVDADGMVREAPNLPGWLEPFALGEALAGELGLPVVVENDVNAGIVAEHRLGAARGEDDVLGLFVGTGVGGALILDGRLRRGASGGAGEIGHTVVARDGRRCGCGGLGHLEAYAGRAGMERRARKLEAGGEQTLLVDLAKRKRMTSSVFAKALAGGDKVAAALVDEAVGALGLAVASAATLLDLRLVVMGGGLAERLGAPFAAQVEKAARKLAFAEARSLRVVPALLGDRGGATGAAVVGRERAGAG